MELGVGTRGPFSSFLWHCLVSLLPLWVISKFTSKGAYPTSPMLIMVLAELIKALVAFTASRRTSGLQGEPVEAVDEGTGSTSSSPRNHSWTVKWVTQISGLSLLNVVCTVLLLSAAQVTPLSTLALAATSSNWISGLISMCYLQDSFSSQQYLVIAIHVAGIMATQWNACTSSSISPFWLYVLLFLWVYLQQMAQMWQTAILRYGGQPQFVTSTMMALFSLPLAAWAWFSLPTDLFSVMASTSFFSWSVLVPTLIIATALAIASMLETALLTQHTISSVGRSMAPVGAVWLLYVSDWLDHRAYVTLTVWIGLTTVSIAVYAFLAFANDLAISVKPGFRKSADGTCCGILSAGLPDFVVVKCGWKHVLGTVLVIFFLIFTLQQATSSESIEPAIANATRLLSTPAPVPLIRHFNPNVPPDSRMHYLASDRYYEWDGRYEDEEEQMDSLVRLYFKKRAYERQHKTTAVCLAGHMRDGYANDLQWLHTLFKSIGSYDLFVWQSPWSLPFNTGALKPRYTSLARSPGAPGGMYRRFNKYNRDHNEDWAYHMWGWSHCVDLINKHHQKTGSTYDFMLLSVPNATFTDFPIPKQATWDTTAISFMPTPYLLETAMFGPFDKMASYAPLMHSSIMSWSGNKTPREYNRGLARARGFTVKEYP